MSDSLSSADRDARIAEIETTNDGYENVSLRDVEWLVAELRASLAREAAWKRAHDRLFAWQGSLSENG